MKLLFLILCSLLQNFHSQTLFNKAATLALDKLNLNQFIDISKAIQFWQTWSALQVAAYMEQSQWIDQQTKNRVKFLATREWNIFLINNFSIPTYFKDPGLFDDHNFWNHSNVRIIWDDRQWLILSYLKLYSLYNNTNHQDVIKYFKVPPLLYDMILEYNANPNSPDYRGIEWKPKSDYRNAVTNEQFFTFSGRMYNLTKEARYLEIMRKQFWLLFQQPNKYINNNTFNVFPDEVGPDGYYTYNQGIVLEGLSFLIVYDTQDKTQHYLSQLARLVNGFIRFFRKKDSQKFILLENVQISNENVQGVFRAILFRHLSWVKTILQMKTGLWQSFLQRTPILKIFILDNYQAMMKFESVAPTYDWYTYDSAISPQYYSVYGLFYVLHTGHKFFSISELPVEGIALSCNNIIQLSYTQDVQSVNITTYKSNIQTGIYQINKTYSLVNGFNNMKTILGGEQLCHPSNNRNIFNFQFYYKSKRVNYTFVHIEAEHSKFGFISDSSSQNIINNRGVRIPNVSCATQKKVYQSITGAKVTLRNDNIECSSKETIKIQIN